MLHCILQSLTQLGARQIGAMVILSILSSVQEVGGGKGNEVGGKGGEEEGGRGGEIGEGR